MLETRWDHIFLLRVFWSSWKEWSGIRKGCPGQWLSPYPWRGLKALWMWLLRIWLLVALAVLVAFLVGINPSEWQPGMGGFVLIFIFFLSLDVGFQRSLWKWSREKLSEARNCFLSLEKLPERLLQPHSGLGKPSERALGWAGATVVRDICARGSWSCKERLWELRDLLMSLSTGQDMA